MDVTRCASPLEFLDATSAYRGAEPLRTNVLGSVASGVASGSRRYDAYFWWVVFDGHDEVVGAAMRTPPFGLSIGPMVDDAAAALARVVAQADDGLPSIGGPRGAVLAFLGAYAATGSPGSARRVGAGRRDVLYALDELVVPDVDGAPLGAGIDDARLAEAWLSAFTEEVERAPYEMTHADRDALHDSLTRGRWRWWCRDGSPVAMAGHAIPVEAATGMVTRVGPVYTPPSERRHGYGAAITAEVTRLLLDGGSKVMLFADADNPTSNGVYRSLGYVVVDEFVRRTIDAAPR
jgi:GNAT superfamily N-acetyltransferase